MSDFDVEPELSDIPDEPLSQEKIDACDRAYGPFDQAKADAAVKAEFEAAGIPDKPVIIVPAENTPDDAPPL